MENSSSKTIHQLSVAGPCEGTAMDAAAQLEAIAQGLQQTGFQRLLRQLASDLIADRLISIRPPQRPAQWSLRP